MSSSSASTLFLLLAVSVAAQTPAPPGFGVQPGLQAKAGAEPVIHGDRYSAGTVVAIIGGTSLTLGDLLFRLAQIPDEARAAYLARPDGLRLFLHDVVDQEALLAAARRAGVDEDPLFARLLELKRAEVTLDLWARRSLLADLGDAQLRKRYDDQVARFTVAPLVRLRQILVTPVKETRPFNRSGDDAVGDEAARAKVERLRAEVVANGSLAAVAGRDSEDVSARSDGDLGWVNPSSLVPELARAVQELPVGEVSPVVRSALGYHLLEVSGRRGGGTVPFDAVRELLLQEAVAEHRAELLAKARTSREALERSSGVQVFPDRMP